MEQAAVAPKRIVMARRLKKPDGEVDFFLMNQGCRGSRRAEDRSRTRMLVDTSEDVNGFSEPGLGAALALLSGPGLCRLARLNVASDEGVELGAAWV